MPNALPLAVPYRDRKRYAWLFSLFIPATVLIGPALMLTTGNAWALWLPVVFFYSVVPLLDFFMGEDQSNPPEAAVIDGAEPVAAIGKGQVILRRAHAGRGDHHDVRR